MSGQRLTLRRSILITLAGTAFPPAAALVTAPILAQGLGVEGRGQTAAAQAVSMLVVSLAAFGLPEAITHFVARGVVDRNHAMVKASLFACASGLLGVLCVVAAGGWLAGGDQMTRTLILVAALTIVPNILIGLARGRAAGLQLWGRIAAERIVANTARLVGAAGLFTFDVMTPMSATIIMTASPLLGGLAYIRLGGGRIGSPDSLPSLSFSVLSNYGSRVWLGSVSGILLMRLDQSLLVPLSGATALGLYSVAASISEIPLVTNSAIREVAFARQSGGFAISEIQRMARLSALAGYTIALPIAFASPMAIPWIFGPDFRGAIPATLILLVAVTTGTPGSIAGAGLAAIGRPGLRSLSLALAAITNVLLLLLLAPPFGAEGAAAATLAGNAVSSNLNILALKRIHSSRWRSYYAITRSEVKAAQGLVNLISSRLWRTR